MKTVKSFFLRISKEDLIKGFIMSILGTLLLSIYQLIQEGTLEFTWVIWKPIILGAIGAGIGYLIKNLFTNSDGKFLKKETPKEEITA